MIFCVEYETKEVCSFDGEALARTVGEAVAAAEGIPETALVNLCVTGEEEIRELNARYRKRDEATDVLSFPAFSFETPGGFAGMEEEMQMAADPETGQVWLGDIVLNLQRVRSQAEEYGHSEAREFGFLIAHSLLHLIGYDHETAEEARVMEEKQEKALRAAGLTRGV